MMSDSTFAHATSSGFHSVSPSRSCPECMGAHVDKVLDRFQNLEGQESNDQAAEGASGNIPAGE